MRLKASGKKWSDDIIEIIFATFFSQFLILFHITILSSRLNAFSYFLTLISFTYFCNFLFSLCHFLASLVYFISCCFFFFFDEWIPEGSYLYALLEALFTGFLCSQFEHYLKLGNVSQQWGKAVLPGYPAQICTDLFFADVIGN